MGSFASHGSDYWTGNGGGNHKHAGSHHVYGWGLINEWEAQAACQDTPIEWWFGTERAFGDRQPVRTRQQTAQAKAICARCPVLDDCRRWAMESGITYGIVGAMTEPERKRLLAEGEAAWQEFWKAQDKLLGRRKRMGGNHNGNTTHCKNGHPYDAANTYFSKGKRFCVACRNIRNKRYQRRKREELGDWLWAKQRQNGHLTG
jgi:WhiB family redox-sensing transcriptional regulator